MSYRLKLAAQAYAYQEMRNKFLTEDYVPSQTDFDDISFAYDASPEAEEFYIEKYNEYLEAHSDGS